MTTLTRTAAEILAISPSEPERLFTADPAIAKAEYRALASAWHPDRNADPGAAAVFDRITSLYQCAGRRLASGTWQLPGLLRLTAAGGKIYEIRYRKRRPFELGEMYIGRSMVAFVTAGEYADLHAAAIGTIGTFHYATPAMRAEISRYLPAVVAAFNTRDSAVLVIEKAPDQVLLRDLLEHLGGRLSAEHTAWILSSLLNLACYLQYVGLTHNAISPDCYFVSPAAHNGALLGGWWYAAASRVAIGALPAYALGVLPPDMLAGRRADARLDLELIRAAGRELLGDPSGVHLAREPTIPAPLIRWLRIASTGDAMSEYEHWQRSVLTESFGARRFVRLNIAADDIYS